MISQISSLLCVFLLYGTFPSLHAEKHSLYYIYTALSKPVDLPGIYEFTAMGLLDDRQIDYYNSDEQRKIPKQTWMKEKMQEDYWEKGTQSRKSKEQWFNVNVHILMNRMNLSEADLHVLQWRHGCEVEQQGNEYKFSKGIDEYGFDGENFLSFDDSQSQWVAAVNAALPTKRKWDNVPILNQYTKGYLEKECVDWLNKFREYADEEFRNGSPPQVHVFAKKSTFDKTKLKLICLATGFHPKDVTLKIRKDRTSLPEDEIESSGVWPNHDETFQLRKSVWIKEEKADYDCFVSHRTLNEPVISKWDGKCLDCFQETTSPETTSQKTTSPETTSQKTTSPETTSQKTSSPKTTSPKLTSQESSGSADGLIGAVIGGLIVLVVISLVVFILKKKKIIVFRNAPDAAEDESDVPL